jgi:hypothetical protein
MDKITMDILKQAFLDRHSGWCVSLFMPTHRSGRDTEQDPIRFKNLIREVEESLTAKGLRAPEVQELLKESRRLLQDRDFWQRQSDGLAVFFSAGTLHYFRLPITFKELAMISHRFHIKPLLPILAGDGLFYILALSQNQIRLLEGTRHTVDEIELEAVAQSLLEAFPEVSTEKQLQFHTGTSSGAGNRAAMFHGHDAGNKGKDMMLQWFRMIDRKLRGLFSDGPSPLILAGVDSLFPIYREANTYQHLLEGGIPGNPESLKLEELHGQAWQLVEPVFNEARGESTARYRQLAGTGGTTSDVKEGVLAAHQGRIDVLFVAVGVQVWGKFDPDKKRVHVHESLEPGDEDLLDLTAIQTLINGGIVYAVLPEEVPDQAPLAAVLRY